MIACVLFTTDDSPISQYIKSRQGPASLWTHAGLLLDSERLLECTPVAGVRVFPIQRRVKEAKFYALRQYECKSLNYKEFLGRPYDPWWTFNRAPVAPVTFDCATLLGAVLGLKGPRHPRLNLSELFDRGEPLPAMQSVPKSSVEALEEAWRPLSSEGKETALFGSKRA